MRRTSPMAGQQYLCWCLSSNYKRLEKVLADQAYKGELDRCLQAAYECVLEMALPREKKGLQGRVIALDCRADLCLVGQCPSVMSRL